MNRKRGITLVEALVSVAVIGLVVVMNLQLFIASARNNNKAEKLIESTYIGKNTIEMIYGLSKRVKFEDVKDELINKGYTEVSKNKYGMECEHGTRYTEINLEEYNGLIRVKIKVYGDLNKNVLDVQYESLYPWLEEAGGQ